LWYKIQKGNIPVKKQNDEHEYGVTSLAATNDFGINGFLGGAVILVADLAEVGRYT